MKEKPIRVKLTRKQAAPRNLAAKALSDGHFKPKIEPDPKGYRRKPKHRADHPAGSDPEE